MRRARGCISSKSESRSAGGWWDQFRAITGGPDGGMHLKTALIDRPAGDPYLNKGLWEAVGRPLPHELTTRLAQNGLRVGLFSGIIPSEFEQLIRSDHATINMMLYTAQSGKPRVIPVNGPLETCSYQVRTEIAGDPVRLDLAAAELGLSIAAVPLPGGRIRLTCQPQVQHGDKQAYLQPSTDNTSFVRQDHKPLETYPTLQWDVTVSPDDYLVIGATEDPVGTLGQALFFTSDGSRVRQRALVVRATGAPVASGGKPVPKPAGDTTVQYGITAQR
ncbi:hypothetical protein [Fimbriiglobus ruber]|uniref:Uncharacterized protein n=1 Tax=Fimbriiglobus ruber TaxID=1908690 RepID=A0A225DXN9_9BACT|nr:hypothetical protein [Fimbriiglobus ruber]OWK44344.1 hypothetical protein FRUB_02276 [Fimbriiglobus ruber]